jgi:hypothetical protein
MKVASKWIISRKSKMTGPLDYAFSEIFEAFHRGRLFYYLHPTKPGYCRTHKKASRCEAIKVHFPPS